MRRQRILAAAAAATLAFGWAPATAHAAGSAAYECTSSRGVWVVVAQHGSVTAQGCYRGSGTGLDALRSVTSVEQRSSDGIICRVGGYPTSPNLCSQWDHTNNPFWFYFLQTPAGSGWQFSNIGAQNRTVVPGTVEGWNYGSGQYPLDPPPSPDLSAPAAPAPAPAQQPTQQAPAEQPAQPAPANPAPANQAPANQAPGAAAGQQSAPPGSAATSGGATKAAAPGASETKGPDGQDTPVATPAAGGSQEASPSAAASSASPSAASAAATSASGRASVSAGSPVAQAPSSRASSAPAGSSTSNTPLALLATLGLIAVAAAGGAGWWWFHRARP